MRRWNDSCAQGSRLLVPRAFQQRRLKRLLSASVARERQLCGWSRYTCWYAVDPRPRAKARGWIQRSGRLIKTSRTSYDDKFMATIRPLSVLASSAERANLSGGRDHHWSIAAFSLVAPCGAASHRCVYGRRYARRQCEPRNGLASPDGEVIAQSMFAFSLHRSRHWRRAGLACIGTTDALAHLTSGHLMASNRWFDASRKNGR